ncbi:MAG: class I SAM-dependent methyltransferase, partial [Acidobacteriota bacterium]
MRLSNLVTRSLLAFLLICITVGLYALEQPQNSGYKPKVGQEGKDVIWVPTPDELVDKMLEIADVSANDFVIDLGSGDGRTVIAAAKLGARALGIEFNPDMIELSKKNAEEAGVSGKTEFIQADFFECDLSEATVITMFLLPSVNLELRPRLLDLKPGTRIVSNTFSMSDWEPDYEATTSDWVPDYEATTEEDWNSWTTALLWVVPAKVEGTWKLQEGGLTIRQEFQMLYGTYKSENKTTNINNGKLNGDGITFSIDVEEYTGRLNGGKT